MIPNECCGHNMMQTAAEVGERITEKPIERSLTIPVEDIRLIADQTGKSLEEAKRALQDADGDLAKAILLLQTGG